MQSNIAAFTQVLGANYPIEFIATNGETATILAIHNKIGMKVNSNTGLVEHSKNASVVFSESILSSANPNYPIRNSNQEVAMLRHRINVKDNTSIVKNYDVIEIIPDENAGIGLITLLLGNYEQ